MAEEKPGPERREEGRAPITLKVDYKRLNSFFADYTKNISKGGTFIRTNKPLEIGTSFVFILTLPDALSREDEAQGATPGATVELELKGVVKWVVAEAAATADKPAGMGIQFVFDDPGRREDVERRVHELMRASLGPVLATKLLTRD